MGSRVTVYSRPDCLEAYVQNGCKARAGSVCSERRGKSPSEARTASKRRSRIRRYAAKNHLSAFLTLTCDGREPSRADLFAAGAKLMRNVRNASGGDVFPFVWVVEGGDGLRERGHLHALVPSCRAPVVLDRWAYGLGDKRELESVQDIRATALYLAKAVPCGQGKQLRYGPRFAPAKPITTELDSAGDVQRCLVDTFGSPPCQSKPILSDGTDGHQLGELLLWER